MHGCVQRKDELLLSEHFAEGVRQARRRCGGAPLRVLNFDWHGMTKDLRERGAVEGLWALLESVVSEVSFPWLPGKVVHDGGSVMCH